MTDEIIRKAERNRYCRGCDNEILKGVSMIYTYSLRNSGMNIMFCMSRADAIVELTRVDKDGK